MKSEDINTIGDMIQWLMQFDPNKKIHIYDNELDRLCPIQHIDVEDDHIVMYY